MTTPHDGNNGQTNGNLAAAATRQHRLTPTNHQHARPTAPATLQGNIRPGNIRNQSTVKLWLIKGMVQVRLPNASRNGASISRCHIPKSRSTPSCAASAAVAVSPGGVGGGGGGGGGGVQQAVASAETSRLISTSASLVDNGGTPEHVEVHSVGEGAHGEHEEVTAAAYGFSRHAIRSNYMDKSIEAKKKVIRMLFVIIAEFFVCWAPLHVLNTWYLFRPEAVYEYVGSTGVSLVQLLAYVSSCCNPITYCFMNRKFRQAFIGVFDCYGCWSSYCCCCCGEIDPSGRASTLQRVGRDAGLMGANNSDVSANDSTMFAGRIPRSEVMVLEAEDRV